MAAGFAHLLGKLGPHVGVPPDPVRSRILALARRRFREQGFARLPIEALCSELGMAKKTFYRYFADKHDLVHALVADSFTRWLPELARLEADDVDAHIATTLSRLLEMSAAEWSARFLHDIQVGLPELWQTLELGRQHLAAQLARLIERGQAEGVYRADIDAKSLAVLIRLIVERVLEPGTMLAAGLEPARAGALLIQLIRAGLRPARRARTTRGGPP